MDDDVREWGKIAKAPARKLNKSPRRRLNWKQKERQGDGNVVKGISHRVIVVRSPDERYFEEAIFVLREDALGLSGVDSETIVREARRIAGSYVKGAPKLKKTSLMRLPAPIFAAAGAAATGLIWLTASLCGL